MMFQKKDKKLKPYKIIVDDLKKLAEELEKKFKIKTIQAYTHKDEGHYDEEKNWKPNLMILHSTILCR